MNSLKCYIREILNGGAYFIIKVVCLFRISRYINSDIQRSDQIGIYISTFYVSLMVK